MAVPPLDRRRDDERLNKLERRVDVLFERQTRTDEWVEESREFHKTMNTFRDTLLAEQAALAREQSRRHRSNAAKLNALLVIAAFLGVFVSVLAIIVTYKIANHQSLAIPDIFRSEVAQPQQADAALPNTFVAR